jgi:hypothetical protein
MIMDIPIGFFPLYSGRLFHADNATIHAGWELLLWLNGWKREKDTKLDKFAPLSYPYYLSFDENGAYYDRPKISTGALDPDADKVEKVYQKSLIEFSVYAATKDSLDFVAEYQKKTAEWKKKPEKKREHINEFITSWWEKMSDVKSSQSIYCTFCHPLLPMFSNCPWKRARKIKSFTSRYRPTERTIKRMYRNNSGETFHTPESPKL